MKEKETRVEKIANHVQYQNLSKFYNLYFGRKYKKDFILYEDESMMESLVGESDYYGLLDEKDVKDLELITETIERNAKRQLIDYQNKLIIKTK
tara:strand:- start:49 stop:330 length:282 start_codon:yes stop_codon:yes gene_type:complete